jgi:hypothetical protein
MARRKTNLTEDYSVYRIDLTDEHSYEYYRIIYFVWRKEMDRHKVVTYYIHRLILYSKKSWATSNLNEIDDCMRIFSLILYKGKNF